MPGVAVPATEEHAALWGASYAPLFTTVGQWAHTFRPAIPPNNHNPGSSRSLRLRKTAGTQSRNGLEIAQNTPEDKAIFQAGMYQGPGVGWEV